VGKKHPKQQPQQQTKQNKTMVFFHLRTVVVSLLVVVVVVLCCHSHQDRKLKKKNTQKEGRRMEKRPKLYALNIKREGKNIPDTTRHDRGFSSLSFASRRCCCSHPESHMVSSLLKDVSKQKDKKGGKVELKFSSMVCVKMMVSRRCGGSGMVGIV
jgi:hypothetical protein